MSGLDRSSGPERHDDTAGADERPWPDDYTLEERRFAEELRAFFPVEDEELPPLYIETLMGDARSAPLTQDDVRRMTYNVERKLGLPRAPLFRRQWAPGAWADQVSLTSVTRSVQRASRPLVAVVGLVIFCMMATMFLATPSFAQGLRLLFGQTGAQQLQRYPDPSVVATEPKVKPSSNNSQSVSMPMFWMGTSVGDYVYQGMRTLPQQEYSRDSILDLQYVLSERNAQQTGDGILDIREFQLASSLSAVLQSVQDGSASVTSVNGLPAVYVDGMWVTSQGQRTSWQSGTRSMLIFERDGVIFWIVGDQRDGLDEAQLVQFASQMAPTTMASLVQSNLLSVRLIGAQLSASMRDPIGYNTELLSLIPRSESPESAAGEFVTPGSPQPPQMNPMN